MATKTAVKKTGKASAAKMLPAYLTHKFGIKDTVIKDFGMGVFRDDFTFILTETPDGRKLTVRQWIDGDPKKEKSYTGFTKRGLNLTLDEITRLEKLFKEARKYMQE